MQWTKSHFIFQSPVCGQSSADRSRDSASETIVARAFRSSERGMTAVMRGAPSTPLNIFVAETRAFLFCACTCFAVLRLLSLDCAATLDVGIAVEDT